MAPHPPSIPLQAAYEPSFCPSKVGEDVASVSVEVAAAKVTRAVQDVRTTLPEKVVFIGQK